MGRLENGQWILEEVISKSSDGEFKRQQQSFRDRITDEGPFTPEPDRYHLYVSYACPWAHRALIMRSLKGLESLISISVVSPYMLDQGWSFESDHGGVMPDEVFRKKYLREVYTAVDPTFTGRVTVPILLDKKTRQIVNNESSEVIRIFNQAFDKLTGNTLDFYPESLRTEIDAINEDIYANINNGVYKTGFALNQEAYEKNFKQLFSTLDQVEERLAGRQYLVGNQLTEADVRLFTTLVRFDPVYFGHFKCNRTLIRETKHLSRYLTRLLQDKAFSQTTHMDHIKNHYYGSHKQLNPLGIVPLGMENP